MSFLIVICAGVIGFVLAFATWKAPRITSVVIWTLTAAMMLQSALAVTLPFEFRSLALWLAICMPLIWVGFQLWCFWERRSWVVASGMLAVTAVSTLVVLIAPPLI